MIAAISTIESFNKRIMSTLGGSYTLLSVDTYF